MQLPSLWLGAFLTGVASLSAADRFVGDTSCSTSGCHGGAGDRGQSLLCAEKDFHARARAILLTPRSQRMAETLKLPDAATSQRCLVCHSPMEAVAPERLAVKPDQAVSCESCHGPAERWLRSHTRADFSHANRVADGMRDLAPLTNRATACVACHQNLDQDILESGHPELTFELDGQTHAQPPHWQEKTHWLGPQIWLAGQSAAWREMVWQMERQSYPALQEREAAFTWLFRYLKSNIDELPEFLPPDDLANREIYARQYAERAAAYPWNPDVASRAFAILAASEKEFDLTPILAARRAEVLVLALDRILPATKFPVETRVQIQTQLDSLFQQVQIPGDFQPNTFQIKLAELHKIVSDS